jgi:hypothetical protein
MDSEVWKQQPRCLATPQVVARGVSSATEQALRHAVGLRTSELREEPATDVAVAAGALVKQAKKGASEKKADTKAESEVMMLDLEHRSLQN